MRMGSAVNVLMNTRRRDDGPPEFCAGSQEVDLLLSPASCGESTLLGWLLT